MSDKIDIRKQETFIIEKKHYIINLYRSNGFGGVLFLFFYNKMKVILHFIMFYDEL